MGYLTSRFCFANPVSGHGSTVLIHSLVPPTTLHFPRGNEAGKCNLDMAGLSSASSPATQVFNLPPCASPVWVQSQLSLQGAQNTLVSEFKRVPLLPVASCTTEGCIFN